jgi:3'-phosphoadenosine 5'-phosphosulfate sulfotransferase (PAPS reductase)/FAD synthetase
MNALKRTVPVSNYWVLVGKGVLLPFHKYKKIVVAFSGGKDSLAAVLMLLDMGVPKEKIELWHHLIDGKPGTVGHFDWPITEDYCRAVAQALGLVIRFSWKDGGFERELLRENTPTSGVYYEDENRKVQYCAPQKPISYCKHCRVFFDDDEQAFCPQCNEPRDGFGTRMKYPMTIADLNRRWCSAYLKIDVCKRVLTNDPRFKEGNVLIVSGERREESTARSNYEEVFSHKSSNKVRRVDQWRGVLDWTEKDVWDAIAAHRIIPHPCYRIGFSRCSCMCCIFSNEDQWATVKRIAPDSFNYHAQNEKRFGLTIHSKESVEERASCGSVLCENAPQYLIDLARSQKYPRDQVILPAGAVWETPSGAFKKSGGPI